MLLLNFCRQVAALGKQLCKHYNKQASGNKYKLKLFYIKAMLADFKARLIFFS